MPNYLQTSFSQVKGIGKSNNEERTLKTATHFSDAGTRFEST